MLPAKAIAAVASDVLRTGIYASQTHEPALVFANGDTGARQREILDAARRLGLLPRLLWRPWQPRWSGAGTSIGRLGRPMRRKGSLSGGCFASTWGWTDWMAAVLEVVPKSGDGRASGLASGRLRPWQPEQAASTTGMAAISIITRQPLPSPKVVLRHIST